MQNQNITIYFQQINSTKFIQFKFYFSLCDTEETQILNFSYLFNVLRRNLVSKVTFTNYVSQTVLT